MSQVSVREAAKLVNKSRDTINVATKDGTLSYSLNARGHKVIDISELERVFPIVQPVDILGQSSRAVRTSPNVSETGVRSDSEALLLKLKHEQEIREIFEQERRREREQMQDEINNLRSTLEKAQEQHSKALLLITDQSTEREGDYQQSIAQLRERIETQTEHFEAKLSDVQDSTRQHTLNQVKPIRDYAWWDLLLVGLGWQPEPTDEELSEELSGGVRESGNPTVRRRRRA